MVPLPILRFLRLDRNVGDCNLSHHGKEKRHSVNLNLKHSPQVQSLFCTTRPRVIAGSLRRGFSQEEGRSGSAGRRFRAASAMEKVHEK